MQTRIGPRELDPDMRRRILQAAGGNPLFVEEMAAMLQTDGQGEIEVPPTIQALLASRLDQLEGPDRSVLERGAVEGELFHQGAVSALTPDEPRLTTRLTALVRKEFVRPDRPQFAGTDAFRFRHLLVRDAAYDGLPKAERAELHERFADWLEEHGHELVELDELAGYHLEQAYRYLEALGRVDEQARDLAVRAGQRLAAAGGRAVLRNDFRAGLNLLDRAAVLLPSDLRSPRFEVDLGWARFGSGQIAEALAGLAAAADRFAGADDRVVELALRLEKGNYDLLLGSAESAASQRRLVDEALPIIEADGDVWALTVADASLVILGQLEKASNAELIMGSERAIAHARQANDPLWADWAERLIPQFQLHGDTPVAECLRWLDEHPHVERHSVVPLRDRLLAMLGKFDEAHALLTSVAERARELGAARFEMTLGWHRFELASLEGNWAEAEGAAQQACEAAEANEELVNYMLYCCMRAQALVELGRPGEAEECVRRGEELAPSHELDPQVRSRFVRARILAGRDEFAEAEMLAREAAARAAETDMLDLQGEALLALAEVLALAGKDSRPELEQALALYERKGNLVMAERVRAQLAAAA
jgi:tetratricopeptide (TPR) repeat protein